MSSQVSSQAIQSPADCGVMEKAPNGVIDLDATRARVAHSLGIVNSPTSANVLTIPLDPGAESILPTDAAEIIPFTLPRIDRIVRATAALILEAA